MLLDLFLSCIRKDENFSCQKCYKTKFPVKFISFYDKNIAKLFLFFLQWIRFSSFSSREKWNYFDQHHVREKIATKGELKEAFDGLLYYSEGSWNKLKAKKSRRWKHFEVLWRIWNPFEICSKFYHSQMAWNSLQS